MAYDSIIQLSQINIRITKGYKRSFPKWFSFWSVILLILFQGTTKQDSNSEICQEALFCWFRHCHPQIKWCLSGMHVHKFLPINCTASHQKLLLKKVPNFKNHQINKTYFTLEDLQELFSTQFQEFPGISSPFDPKVNGSRMPSFIWPLDLIINLYLLSLLRKRFLMRWLWFLCVSWCANPILENKFARVLAKKIYLNGCINKLLKASYKTLFTLTLSHGRFPIQYFWFLCQQNLWLKHIQAFSPVKTKHLCQRSETLLVTHFLPQPWYEHLARTLLWTKM